jgi:phosphoribosylformimino-5-aminoimidazole carboxamide ribotide isomerase
MQGTNHALYQTLSQSFQLQIIASGGVSSIADVQRLAQQKLYGAIVGKAYYSGDIRLAEAIEVAK